MILICGASGLVGKEMCKLLDSMQISYIGTYNNSLSSKPNMFRVNFSDASELEEFMKLHKISTCVFCIVERVTDVCEKDWSKTKKTNIDLVHITSYLCNKLDIHFTHLSTDYVFDGSTQPNYPNSLKNPLQNYGISKLISEYRVVTNCKNSCIIRTPVLYSPLSAIHDNAVCLIGKNAMDLRVNSTIKEDNYSIRRPLYISDLCKFIYECILLKKTGIYHFYNPYNKFTKYEMAHLICDYLGKPTEKILPSSTIGSGIAPRPYDTQLCDDRITITDYKFTPFYDSIADCFSKFKHPNINITNKDDIFITLDLDGTIVDTNYAHYNAYKRCFDKHNKMMITFEEWNHIISNDHIDNYLKTVFDDDIVSTVKRDKRILLNDEQITFTNNSEIFLRFLIDNDFNFCVVTNTSRETVDIFKTKLPLLNDIKKWVFRDDYTEPKPNSECYYLAKNKYYNGEKYIIGYEDSMVGYRALKNITDIIYLYDNISVFAKNDCYIFDDFFTLIF
jgi:dTDP-4-dehydrorhamnose reductase